jgi:dienelactone hydrolase
MAEVVLFHHAQGLTPGIVAWAGELRQAGHTVHTPDLFDGRTFGSIEEGMGQGQRAVSLRRRPALYQTLAWCAMRRATLFLLYLQPGRVTVIEHVVTA